MCTCMYLQNVPSFLPADENANIDGLMSQQASFQTTPPLHSLHPLPSPSLSPFLLAKPPSTMHVFVMSYLGSRPNKIPLHVDVNFM